MSTYYSYNTAHDFSLRSSSSSSPLRSLSPALSTFSFHQGREASAGRGGKGANIGVNAKSAASSSASAKTLVMNGAGKMKKPRWVPRDGASGGAASGKAASGSGKGPAAKKPKHA